MKQQSSVNLVALSIQFTQTQHGGAHVHLLSYALDLMRQILTEKMSVELMLTASSNVINCYCFKEQ